MRKFKQAFSEPNFYGIGIINGINKVNIGTLWRSAYILGASFIFTVNKKYKFQASDVMKTPTRIPLYNYDNINDLKKHLPHSTKLIGVELIENAQFLNKFEHPQRGAYLLGSEANGLLPEVLEKCHHVIKLPGNFSLNVTVAGSIVMHDRICKLTHKIPTKQNKNLF